MVLERGTAVTGGRQGRRKQSLLPTDFQRLDGTPCRAGEPCVDYGAPLTVGFVTEFAISGSNSGGALTPGVDNWKVTVWRR